jgi:hypothetical protein
VRSRFYLNVLPTALLLYAGSLAASEAPQAAHYETPGPVNAQDFLPKSAFSGKKIFVEKVAQNDGLENTYRIRAGGEEYETKGSTAAMEVLQELRAIRQLRQISTTKAFTQGLKESAKGTYQTGKEIVRDHGGALKKVPEGASKFFGKVKGFFSVGKIACGEGEGMKESVCCFDGVFPQEIMRCMAIVAGRYGVMAAGQPGRIIILHHMAVRAAFRIIAQVGVPLGIHKSIETEADHRAY